MPQKVLEETVIIDYAHVHHVQALLPPSSFLLSVSLATCVATLGACGETVDPKEGNFDGTTGEFAAGPLEPGECLTFPQAGVYGYKHQCNGYFLAAVGFTYDETGYELFIPEASLTFFGDGREPYEQAKVIACCGAYDEEEEEEFWPVYAENCMADFRQQACMSITTALKTAIDDGQVPNLAKSKAIEVQNWLAERTTECMIALGTSDSEPDPEFMTSIWNLPNNGPWAPQLEDVYLKIYFTSISGLHLPETPDTCDSLHDNDAMVFTDQSAPPFSNTFDVDLDEADGELSGPVYGGARITGSGDFASLSTSCSAPYCSTASFSMPEVGNEWALDRLVLYADGPLVVSNGTLYETITDARVELYKQAIGDITTYGSGFTFFTIPAGGAHFVVVGKSGGEIVTLPVSTSTVFTMASMGGGAWWWNEFELEYVDDASDTWTLTVSQSEWL